MELTEALPNTPVVKIRCCQCAVATYANPSNMCPDCIKATVDISEGLIKEYIVVNCPECGRYLQPPKYWVKADLESRELLTLCLKKMRGLARYKVIDAVFLWTESHSKRLKIKLVLQQEIFANTVIQQAVQVDFVVQTKQCELCAKAATGEDQWDAVVQVRQRVEHRRTFLFLEQMILRHNMNDKVIKIGGHPDGLDFFFNHRSHGLQFLDFVGVHAPTHRTDATQLVSHDSKSNTAVQHRAFSLELSPLCREDLVCLPKKLHTQMGGIGPFVLVHKVYSRTVFLDPQSLRLSELTCNLYWNYGFGSYATSRQMSTFFIEDISLLGQENGKMQLAHATVCLEDDIGLNRSWSITTHLGHLLNPGDLAKGYLVSSLNANSTESEEYSDLNIPDVLLVRKHFPNQASRRHKRAWRLKRLDKTVARTLHDAREDFDEFMDDLERDKEFRADIPLYAETDGAAKKTEAANEDDEAVVELDELLDEFQIEKRPAFDRDEAAALDEQHEGQEADDAADEDDVAEVPAAKRNRAEE